MSDDKNYLKPKKKLTIEQVRETFELMPYADRSTADEFLSIAAKVQELKPAQQLRVGEKLTVEDVGLQITVNGHTGVLSDILPWDRDRRPDIRPNMVVNGRIYEIKRGDFYLLTYPEK